MKGNHSLAIGLLLINNQNTSWLSLVSVIITFSILVFSELLEYTQWLAGKYKYMQSFFPKSDLTVLKCLVLTD